MVSRQYVQEDHGATPHAGSNNINNHQFGTQESITNSGTNMKHPRLLTQASTSNFFNRRFEFKEILQNLNESDRWKRFSEVYRPVNVTDEELRKLKTSKTNFDFTQCEDTIENKPSVQSSLGKSLLHIPRNILENRQWKEIRKIGPGLQNLGNTCFMNSVLQCLVYCPPFFYHLVEAGHSKVCKILGFCGYCELERHVRTCFFSTPPVQSVAPKRFATHLRSICKRFKLGRQEDAHEFIRCLLDAIEKSYIQQHYGEEFSAPCNRTKRPTIVQNIFGGRLRSQVKCLSCNNESNTYDPFLDICLDIKNSNTIERAFAQYILPEKLSKDNLYRCDKCHQRVEAEKRMTICDPPAVLTVQLKRFDYFAGHGGKIGKHIQFSESLDLGPYVSGDSLNNLKYQLFSVLVHSGQTCNSGHYYCYVRNSTKVWHCMNDDSVYQTTFTKVMQEPAYLLFYSLEMQRASEPQRYGNHHDNCSTFTANLQIKDRKCSSVDAISKIHSQIIESDITSSTQIPHHDIDHGLKLDRKFQAEASSEEEDMDETLIKSKKPKFEETHDSTEIKDASTVKKLISPGNFDKRISHIPIEKLENRPRIENSSIRLGKKISQIRSNSKIIRRHGSFFVVQDRIFEKQDIMVSKEMSESSHLFKISETQNETFMDNRSPQADLKEIAVMRPSTIDGVREFRQKVEEMDGLEGYSLLKESINTWDGGLSHLSTSLESQDRLEPLGKILNNYDKEYDRGKLKKEAKGNNKSDIFSVQNAFQEAQNARAKNKNWTSRIFKGKRSRRY